MVSLQNVRYGTSWHSPQIATEGVRGHVQLPVGHSAVSGAIFSVRNPLYIAAFNVRGIEAAVWRIIAVSYPSELGFGVRREPTCFCGIAGPVDPHICPRYVSWRRIAGTISRHWKTVYSDELLCKGAECQ